MRIVLSALAIGIGLGAGLLAAAPPVPAQAHQMVKTKSLYDRLGGKAAIQAVVDDFVGNVAADNRINKFFAKTNIPRLKQRLVEQICQGSGGPCKYKGRSMKAAHRGMGVSGADFGALVDDLKISLNKFQVPAREQGELLALLGPMRKDIVEKK
jgi:hemoglobin